MLILVGVYNRVYVCALSSRPSTCRVSTAYATLLAQVVPVLALALGLELRASVGRRNEQAAAAIDADNSKPGFWHGASVGIFGFILTSSPVSRSGHCTWSPARMGSGMT